MSKKNNQAQLAQLAVKITSETGLSGDDLISVMYRIQVHSDVLCEIKALEFARVYSALDRKNGRQIESKGNN